MKKILSTVSVDEMRGPVNKFLEMLSSKKNGHYMLSQLNLLMEGKPTHTMQEKWLKKLSQPFTWNQAEDHQKETGDLWYNERSWPFQICVLNVGKIDNELLSQKWSVATNNSFESIELGSDIKYLDLTDLDNTKIHLVRIKPSILGIKDGTNFGDINCDHPQFNLSPCPQGTAFVIRLFTNEYYGREMTLVTGKFSHTAFNVSTSDRTYNFQQDYGSDNKIKMGFWMTYSESAINIDRWLIFQYNLEAKE